MEFSGEYVYTKYGLQTIGVQVMQETKYRHLNQMSVNVNTASSSIM